MIASDQSTHRAAMRAFTLVELLVVIAIIAMLVTLLLPAVQAAREAARRALCQSNLKQLGLAVLTFENARGQLVPARYGCDGQNCTPNSWSRGASGFLVLLPFLEEQPLYDTIDFADGPWKTPHNAPERDAVSDHGQNEIVIATPLEVMNCPSDAKRPSVDFKPLQEATGSYAFCAGTHGPSAGISAIVKYENDGVFMYLADTERLGFRLRNITDGLSHTIFIGETIDGHLQNTRNRWTAAGRHVDGFRTTDNPMNAVVGMGWAEDVRYGYSTTGAFASHHAGGVQFVFGDGHVQLLSEDIPLQLYRALSTRAGAENLGEQ